MARFSSSSITPTNEPSLGVNLVWTARGLKWLPSRMSMFVYSPIRSWNERLEHPKNDLAQVHQCGGGPTPTIAWIGLSFVSGMLWSSLTYLFGNTVTMDSGRTIANGESLNCIATQSALWEQHHLSGSQDDVPSCILHRQWTSHL